jgi:hypothetical protein
MHRLDVHRDLAQVQLEDGVVRPAGWIDLTPSGQSVMKVDEAS